MLCDVERVFSEHSEREGLAKITVAEMQKTILMGCESMIQKVLSGLVQHEDQMLTVWKALFTIRTNNT